MADDAAVCRYCLESHGLICGQVCACRGSFGAHASCLVNLAISRWPKLEVWRTCRICGQVYVGAARLSLAQALFAKVRWKTGSQSVLRQWVVQNLICALYEVGRYQEAAERAKSALDSYAKMSKSQHPRALRVATIYASSLREMGRYEEAVTLQRQTLALQRRTLGNEHPDAIISANNLTSSLSLLGKREEATTLSRQTLEVMKRFFGEDRTPRTGVKSVNFDFAVLIDPVGVVKECYIVQADYQYDFCHCPPCTEKGESPSPKALVPPQNWSNPVESLAAASAVAGFEFPSFSRPVIVEGNYKSHEQFQRSLALLTVQAVAQSQCYRMLEMSCTMADRYGQNISPWGEAKQCPSATFRATFDSVCSCTSLEYAINAVCAPELVPSMARGTARFFSTFQTKTKLSQREVSEKFQSRCIATANASTSHATDGTHHDATDVPSDDAGNASSGSHANASGTTWTSIDGTSSNAATRYSLVYSGHATGNACSSGYAHDASDTNRIQCQSAITRRCSRVAADYENAPIRTAQRHAATTTEGDGQDKSQIDQRPSFCSDAAFKSTSGIRGRHFGAEPDGGKLASFHRRCCETLARLRRELCGTREESAKSHCHSQRDCSSGKGRARQSKQTERDTRDQFRRGRKWRDGSLRADCLNKSSRDDAGIGYVSTSSGAGSCSVDGSRSPRCQETPQRFAATHRRWQAAKWVAFWSGWLTTTSVCGNREPVSIQKLQFDPDYTVVMNWTHRVLREPDFCPTWSAIERARGLAFELGTYGLGCTVPPPAASPTTCADRARRTRKISFSTVIDLHFGNDDSPWAHFMRVPDVCDLPAFRSWTCFLLSALEMPGSFVRSCISSLAIFPVCWTPCVTSSTVSDQCERQLLHFVPRGNPFLLRQFENDWTEGADGSTVEEPLLLSVLSPTMCAQLPQHDSASPIVSRQSDHSLRAPHEGIPGDVIEHRPDPSENPNLPDPPVDSDASDQTGFPDHRRPLRQFPAWVTTLWNVLQDEGATEVLEEGPIVYLGSYYLNHLTCLHQEQNRPVRLTQDYTQWADIIMDVWNDVFDRSLPFAIHLVMPEPPIPVTHGTVGILLIVQNALPHQAATLTTAMYDQVHGPRIEESAHVLHIWTDHAAVLYHAGALPRCREVEQGGFGPCTIRAGRRLFNRDRPLRLHDGLGLVIRIPMMLSQEDWESQVFQRLREQHLDDAPAPSQSAWPVDDATSLMARRPRSYSPTSTCSSSSSDASSTSSTSASSPPIWKRTVVFNLDGQAISVLLPWNDADEIRSRVAMAFSVPPDVIDQLHFVASRPPDFVETDLQCMLLQRPCDQRTAACMRLVLLDTEIYEPNELQPGAFRRAAKWVPCLTTSGTLFRLLGLERVCQQHAGRCHLWLNNGVVDLSSNQPMRIEDGDYLRIFIGDEDQGFRCLDDVEMTGLLQFPLYIQARTHDAHVQSTKLTTCSTLRPPHRPLVHWKLDPDDVIDPSLPQARCDSEVPQALVRPHGTTVEPQLQEDPLWRLWNRPQLHTRGLNNEPVLLFDTWYVNGLGYPKCAVSRAVALDEDLDSWISKLRQVWNDRIHPHAPLELSIVHPEVPHVRHGGHLLLLQAVPAHHRAALLSSYWDPDGHDLQDRFACVVPRRLSFQDLLSLSEVDLVCQQQTFACHAFVGPHRFEQNEVWPVYHGMHVALHLEALPVQSAMDILLAGGASEATSFQPGPVAAPFNAEALAGMSEFTQALSTHWVQLAFSWDGEDAALNVITWMVDHHDQRLQACQQPRLVQLHADFATWELLIRQKWADLLDDNLPANLYVVTPMPPSLTQDAAVHVLVVQRPFVAFASTILTVIDLTEQASPQPLQVAITTLAQIHLEHLLMGLGLEDRCLRTSGDRDCRAWHAEQPLTIDLPLAGRNGLSIILELHARQSVHEETVLLQLHQHLRTPPQLRSERLTNATVAHAHWPEQKASLGGLDLTAVWQRFEAYDQDFLLPCFDFDLALHSDWTAHWWDCCSPVSHVWIYHDGSHKAEGSGAAAVAFLFQPDCGWVFGGALSATFPSSVTSYGAEVRSGILAIQFAIDILKITTLHQCTPPAVCLLHDNTTVGAQLLGQWHASADVSAVAVMRHLAVYCERRFQIELEARHIPAHTGDVGNELADSLASLAADHRPLQDLHVWFSQTLSTDFGRVAAWFWVLFEPNYASWWRGLCFGFPNAASTRPSLDILPKNGDHVLPEEEATGTVELTVGTCNVLTLRAGASDPSHNVQTGISGPTRQHVIFRQFKSAGVCLAVLQETRLQRHCQTIEDYMIFAGAATPQGHFGILAAISTTIPYGTVTLPTGQKQQLFFRRTDVAVIATSPRWVILRVTTPWMKFVLIGAHAPHSGQSLETIETWWDSLSRTIPSSLTTWPKILLVDANAKVGADHCVHIGDLGAEMGSDKAVPFTHFVRDHDLWLPSTFDCHEGPSGTWRHSSGQWLRNDFVGLPMQWAVRSCKSWTSAEIDVSLHHEDHCAALVRFTMDVTRCRHWSRQRLPKHDAEDADLSMLRWLSQPDPALDVHTHAHLLQQQLLECLPPAASSKPLGPRKLKYTMSDHTWTLVKSKRQWRNALHEAQALQRSTLLQGFFVLWRASARQPALHAGHEAFDRLMIDQDRLIAQALFEFRALGRLVTVASRQDDRCFFSQVLQEGADYLQPHQSRDLWKVIKKALPKHQQRRQGVDPLSLMHLEDCWNPHFERLEAGQVLDAQTLLDEALICDGPPTHPPPGWTDIPTLFELEQVLRNNKPGRSTGNDPLSSSLWHNQPAALAAHSFALMVKVWLWGQEPLQYKGGPLALLPKRLHPQAVQHFRGILLLPTLAKGFHAILRKRIIALLHPVRVQGQLGGFAQQEVLYGSHALRILGQLAIARNFSMGVLFVDLATAFHCLIREMVVGTSSSARLDFVVSTLRQSGHPCDHLRLGQELPGLLAQLGAPPYLVRLLQNIHAHTWMTIGTQNYIRTHKGTRPGSPLADAIFHFIMYDVSLALRTFLDEQGHTAFIAEHFEVDLEPIIWSDDLAVPIVTARCSDLVPALLKLLDHVRDLFLQRGFLLNLNKGKTGVVATFCGADAPALRRTVQLVAQPGVHHQFPDGQTTFVHFSPAYRHLGTLYTSDQKLNAEIASRIGAASSAFAQVSRRLLLNRHLPCQLRVQLFRSLILSKLYFGMGAWHTPTGAQLDRLRVVIVRMLRKILKLPSGPASVSAAQLLVDAGIPEPRVQLAMDRLLYAQRLFHHGPSFLQHMVHIEAASISQSWLAGLRHDLQWLYSVEAVPDERLCDQDHTQLIEYWQSAAFNWKSRIRRAGKRHIFQESMLLEAQLWHAKIFDVLRTHAFTLRPDPALLHLQEGSYQCPDCPRTFTTPQGVHTHRRKAHGVYSLEHHLLDSATCPACMTFLWSTQRLQQHLAYMPRDGRPNPCFAHLQRLGYSVSYSAMALPKALQGQSRFDALPAAGPSWCGLPFQERALHGLRSERQRLHAEFADYDAPEATLSAGEKLAKILTQATQQWYSDFQQAHHAADDIESLRDRWIDRLCRLPECFESWASRVFLAWGEHLLPDLVADLLDGDAEILIEEAFADLAGDLHEYQVALRLRQLDLQIARLEEQPVEDQPHRPVRPPQGHGKPRSLPQQVVPRLFDGQAKWHADLRLVEWEDMPEDPRTPMIPDLAPRPSFVVVHLFAGRRRHTDLHAHLAAWAHTRNFALTILSLDTAIAPVLGNLDQRSVTWQRLQELYGAGCISATISGHPCETFSSARWNPPPAEFAHLRWPRPLRTAMQFFGLDHRTLRELHQTKVGTVFFLQTVWALANHLVFGGLFIEEHPDIPVHEDHPSIWRSALLRFFCKHPDVQLHHIRQWRFGAPTSKPTGLLGLRLPHFRRDLYACALSSALPPAEQAIGVNERGEFRTAVHKEYPPALSCGLAHVLAQQLQRDYWARRTRLTEPLSSTLAEWISEVAHACNHVARRTLDIQRPLLGPEHPDVLCTINNLAAALHMQGKRADAICFQQETFDIRRRTLGLGNVETLASMLQQQGRYAEAASLQRETLEAEQLGREAYEEEEEALGRKHPRTLGSAHNLSNILRERGQYRNAVKLLEETKASLQEVCGVDHPRTLVAACTLANLLLKMGRFQRALMLVVPARRVQAKSLGAKHPHFAASTCIFAAALRDLARVHEGATLPEILEETDLPELETRSAAEAALRLAQQALSIQQEILGPKHPNTLDGKLLLAECLLDLGRLKDRNPGLSAAIILAAALSRRRRREAKQLLRGALRVLFKERGPVHPLTLSTISDLLALQSPGNAKIWRVWQAQRQLLGPRHPDVRCSALRVVEARKHSCRKRKMAPSSTAHAEPETKKLAWYVCAPNFWEDLRSTLQAIEQRRDERAGKLKAQQLVKQIARLEVKFWAKASVAMLKELDAESRLERIVDWLQTFGDGDSEDSSSGPAVLFQVLSDVTLQKDFEAPQREALSAAVRDNLPKFPVEMQALLERVGSVTEPRSFAVPDWRRRHQPTQLDAPTLGPGAKLLFGVGPQDELGAQVPKTSTADPAIDGHTPPEEIPVISVEDEAANAEIVQRLLKQKELAEEAPVGGSDAQLEEQPASLPHSVDPFADLLGTIMSWLQQAGGTLEREAVLPLIKAMGFRIRAVIQALSQDVFWSHPEAECEILLRTQAGAALHPKPLPSNYLHDTVRRNLVSHVKQMGSKAKYDKLAGLLGWNAKSELRRTYGALRIVLSGLHETVDTTLEALEVDDSCAADGDCSLELNQLRGMKEVNYHDALMDEDEETHVEGGACTNSKDLNFWKKGGKKSFDASLNQCGRSCAAGFACTKSCMQGKGYSSGCASCMAKLIFYDSTKLYLKQVLEGVVDWPVNKDGRIGPNSNKDIIQHWTRACDDLKGAGDIDWFNAKRQLLGVVMKEGGRLDVQVARFLINPAGEQATLERVFEAGSKYDLTKVLFWEPRRVFRRRQPMAVEDAQGDPELQQALLKVIRAKGSASLDELKAALEEAGTKCYDGLHASSPCAAWQQPGLPEPGGHAPFPQVVFRVKPWRLECLEVPLLIKESPVRVREIWLERFQDNPLAVAGALTDQDFRSLKANAEACPMFVVPLPRGEGYANLVWQAQGNRVLFKTLEGFQQNSPVIDLGVNFFTELSHQLVLLRGEIKSNLLSKDEAAKMVRFMREAYCDPTLFGWVKRFNHSARDFDWQEYMSTARPLEWDSQKMRFAKRQPILHPADESAIHAAAQVIPELFFMPDQVFLRHVALGIIAEDPLAEDLAAEVDEEEELMREALAEVAAAAAAIPDVAEDDPLQIKAPNGNAGAAAQQAKAAGVDPNFFNFSGFVAKQPPDFGDVGPPAKKPKLVPSWLTEGAAVRIRGDAELPGAIVKVKGETCRVQVEREANGATEVVEEELPFSALIPVAPEIGSSVKVVAGDRIGCTGKLVGLAGPEAVVQIGGMCYETLPMGQIAVVAM
eukprot:s367_g24.t2